MIVSTKTEKERGEEEDDETDWNSSIFSHYINRVIFVWMGRMPELIF